MKKVMAFGTFDIFHKGHENFLKQARKYGDYLIVVIARDKTVEEVKGKPSRNDEETRRKKVESSGLADEVVLGNLGDKYAIIKEHQPDVICLGYDQVNFVDKLADKLFAFGLKSVKIVRLAPFEPETYKSSKLLK